MADQQTIRRRPATAAAPEYRAADPPQPTARRPITRTATQARQGEIILGRRGRWLWIAVFVVLALFAVYGLWL